MISKEVLEKIKFTASPDAATGGFTLFPPKFNSNFNFLFKCDVDINSQIDDNSLKAVYAITSAVTVVALTAIAALTISNKKS